MISPCLCIVLLDLLVSNVVELEMCCGECHVHVGSETSCSVHYILELALHLNLCFMGFGYLCEGGATMLHTSLNTFN